MSLNTRRRIVTLALLLSVTSLSWLGWSAQAARGSHLFAGRTHRAATSAPAAAATIFTVNSTADGTLAALAANATCDLREAVEAANTNAVVGQCPAGMVGADTIIFAPNVIGTIGLTAGGLVLSQAVTITGPGANVLAVSGNNASRVFFVSLNVMARLSGLTITGGNGVGTFSGLGGGIFSRGNLTVTASHVTGNTTSTRGGGIYNGYLTGPGVLPGDGGDTLTIERSAVTYNTAPGGGLNGGGIYNNFAGLTVINSTVSGNLGGGIASLGGASITASTITDNVAAGPNGVGGVFAVFGSVGASNSIIAANGNNSTTPDMHANLGFASFNSQGYNLIGNPGNVTAFNNLTPFRVRGDQAGTMAMPLNPMLGPLANNGGPTPTHRPLTGSPAIDKGNSFDLTSDQRGSLRPVDNPAIAGARVGDGADIGALELTVTAPTIAKSFSPPSIIAGGTSTLTITLSNVNDFALTGASITDTLPADLTTIAATMATTCGGTASQTNGSISLNGGIILPYGSCILSVQVTGMTGGTFTNTIPAGALTTTASVTNDAPASAALTVIPTIPTNPVVNVSAASYSSSAIASRAIVAAFGQGLATGTAAATSIPLSTTLAGTTIKIVDSTGTERLAPLFFVSPTQVNYQIPDGTGGTAAVTVTSGDGRISYEVIQVGVAAPSLFTLNASGTGAAAAVDALTGAPAPFSPTRASGQPNIIAFYGTGLGADATDTGGDVSARQVVEARIDGAPVMVLYAGPGPGFVGLNQWNIVLPSGITSGTHTVVVSRNGVNSNTVTIAIQ